MKLCPSHQQPCFPQEGIILPAVQPFDVFWSLPSFLIPYRALLNAMLVDGFLAFQDGSVEVGFSYFFAILVADRIQGDDLRIVVLVACLLFQGTIDVSKRSVVVCVVVRIQGMPPSRLGGVLCCGTSYYDQDCQQQNEG